MPVCCRQAGPYVSCRSDPNGYTLEGDCSGGKRSGVCGAAELFAAARVQQDSGFLSIYVGNSTANEQDTGGDWLSDAGEGVESKLLDDFGLGGLSRVDGVCASDTAWRGNEIDCAAHGSDKIHAMENAGFGGTADLG